MPPSIIAASSSKPDPLWVERTLAIGKMPQAPPLYTVKDGLVRRIDASNSPQWFCEFESWAGSIGLAGYVLFADAVIRFDESGKVLPLEGHDLATILENKALQRIVLKKLRAHAITLDIPSEADIDAMTDKEVGRQFLGLTQALSKVSYSLGQASRPETGGTSVFPDIFNAMHGDLLLRPGVNHPLAALMQIIMIRNKMSKDPSGSAFEMQRNLHNQIHDWANGEDLSIFRLPHIMDDINKSVYAILAKENRYAFTLNGQVQELCCELCITACAKASLSNSSKVQFAGKKIEKAILDLSSGAKITEFADFHNALQLIFTNHLPTAEERKAAEKADSPATLGKRARVETMQDLAPSK